MADHGARAHAIWAPSASWRWVNCAASVARIEAAIAAGISVDEDTVDTVRGTTIHEHSQDHIDKDTNPLEDNYPINGSSRDKSIEIELQPEEWQPYVNEYVTDVRERFEEALWWDESAVMVCEEKVTIFGDECWGSVDNILLSDRILDITDLKAGHDPVSPTENFQLMTYAVGALNRFGWDNVDTVILRINQLDHPNGPRMHWEPTLQRLAVHRGVCRLMIDAAKDMMCGKRKTVGNPGDWCKYCPVKRLQGGCPELNETAIACLEDEESVVFSPVPVEDLDPRRKQVLALLAEPLIKYLGEVKKSIAEEIQNGSEAYNMLKLVQGSANRRWKGEEDEITKALEEKGVEPFKTTKKRTPFGEVEKALGKKRFAKELGHLIEKPPGKPTLVHVDDPRPSVCRLDILDDGET